MTNGERLLALAWLASWGVAVLSQNVPQWWVVLVVALVLISLTTLVAQRLSAAHRLGLQPVHSAELITGAASGAGLFLLYFIVFHGQAVAAEGHVSVVHVLWSVLVAPVTEELAFRAILYNVLRKWCKWMGMEFIGNLFAVLFTAVLFAALHQRTSVYLLMTCGAGVVYGLLRWRTDNVVPAMASHFAYNATVLLFLDH